MSLPTGERVWNQAPGAGWVHYQWVQMKVYGVYYIPRH